jgi:SAM-dependent methyltransferase
MNKWMDYLKSASEIKYNVAHISTMQDLDTNQVAQYVARCLSIANNDLKMIDSQYHKYILRTLQWMDVAKCGSENDRALWKMQCPGICLDIHNEASAEIYLKNNGCDDQETQKIVYALIKTHGLIGQHIMGETKMEDNRILASVDLPKDALFKILKILNHAIIAGVSEDLWKSVHVKVNALIMQVVNGAYREDGTLARLKKLFPAFKNVNELTDEEAELYARIFDNVDLWYPTIALQGFSRKELNTIFKTIAAHDFNKIHHVSFYDLSKELSYDRDGKRKTNVYKKRIIEVLLREIDEDSAALCEKEHVHIFCDIDNACLKFKVAFTPVCEALIRFCVEAERSGFATYSKNIITIFDMFGFRRDIFDRLSNEEAYLATMNNAQASTKMNILDYVQGDSVVDVGSGGGVLLDALEKRFPDKMIAGTDISQNVIEVLQKKIDTEDHSYEIWRHNFVDDALWSPVENIIFSSIIHEIFSYTEMDSKKFNIDSVQRALYHAKESLSSGGRIIIRDGVKTDSNDVVSVRIKDDDMMILAKNYLRDFQGLSELKDENGNWKNLKIDGNVISADINLIREMLYTITWGPMSYAAEVQEQFGYMTLTDYCVALESIGMHIIEAKQFTEPGYPEHLNDKVDLIDFTWDDIPSNCIIVAEKC